MVGHAARRHLLAALARQRALRRGAGRTLAARRETILVPLLDTIESEQGLDLACRLAADGRARVLLVAPLFVEAELPLDAHFPAEERALHGLLERTRALTESYGIGARGRIVRTRHGQLGIAVAGIADEQQATLVVVGAPVESRRGFQRPFSREVWSILRDAPCRVLLASGGGRAPGWPEHGAA